MARWFLSPGLSSLAMPLAATKPAAEPTLILSRQSSVDTPLRIDTIGRDGSLVVVVRGEVDITTSPMLDEALLQARGTSAASIVVDLDGVTFIDSTGLHVLIKHARTDDGRARIRLTRGSPATQRVFELSGTLGYLPFVSEP